MRHYRRVREHGRVRELRAAIHDFIAVCVYWGGAAVLWYLWYRWFMAAVEESPLVAETFLLQIVGMVVLTFVWRRVGACILNRYITCFTCRGRTDETKDNGRSEGQVAT